MTTYPGSRCTDPARAVALVALAALPVLAADPPLPHLRPRGGAVQLIVEGRPMLVRGGELGNSTASNPEYLAPFWPGFAAMDLNTVLVPVSWHLVEPVEGCFDDGVWQNVRWLSGDETHQGRHVRLEPGRFSIQRVKVYSY